MTWKIGFIVGRLWLALRLLPERFLHFRSGATQILNCYLMSLHKPKDLPIADSVVLGLFVECLRQLLGTFEHEVTLEQLSKHAASFRGCGRKQTRGGTRFMRM